MTLKARCGAGISAILLGSALLGCSFMEPKTAILWTDRPEFAVYAEYFNTSQSNYKVEVRYFDFPAEQLKNTKAFPDIVVGSWLKSASSRAVFKPLDYYFEDLLLSETSFYSRLLSLGNIDGKQYLFPVSFNLPAVIFSKDNSLRVTRPFILTLDELMQLGKDYNVQQNGIFSQMGFSPRWNDDFLFVIASLYGASFREGSPLSWNNGALEEAIAAVQRWSADANGGTPAEDEFAFKYLYNPVPLLASTGRILFAYMNSADLFTVNDERRSTLDFRWVAKGTNIPVAEGATYLGLCKQGRAKNATDAFVRWFYQEATQKNLLQLSKQNRMSETLFGIANGFSAIKSVNDQIYPQFYPSLLGHIPPEDYLVPPNILPRDWETLKAKVVLPYLHEKVSGAVPAKEGNLPLDKRLSEWYRLNHGR